MGPIDVVAIVILIVAILVLVYYYLQNNPASVQKLRNYVPATADPHMGEILQNDSDYDDLIWDQCKLCSFNDYNPEDLPDDCKPTEEEKELYRENEIKDIEQIKKTWKECDEFGIEH